MVRVLQIQQLSSNHRKTAGPRIYENYDLMQQIWEFDPTFHNFFIKNFVSNKVILEAAHDFWWKKYIKYLRMYHNVDNLKAIKYVLEIQKGFFDTLYQLSPESFIGED